MSTNSVSAAGLNTLGAPASGQVLTYSGGSLNVGDSFDRRRQRLVSDWQLRGGSLPGTTDNYPLNFVVNDLSAGTFWPFANGSVSVALGSEHDFSTSGNGGNFIAGVCG